MYEKYRPLVEKILDTLRDEGVRLELNSHRLTKTGDFNDMWPENWIVESALEKGVKFSFGSDAHQAPAVGAYLPELREHSLYGKAIAQWENE